MSQRVVIGLEPGADWPAIRQELVARGAETVSVPSPSQPDALVVTIGSDRHLDDFLQQSKTIVGVRYAESDAWQSSF